MAEKLITVTSKPPFRDVAGRFARADKEFLADKRESMRSLGRRWVAIAREEAPMGKTGNFRKSLAFKTSQSGSTVSFSAYSAQPLGKWIVLGTKAHIIRARNARNLRFFWKDGPKGPGTYFFPFVNHPGTKPNPYNQRATDRWMPDADMELRRISRKFVMTMQGKA